MSGVVVRLPSPMVDETFRALGTDVRLIVTGHGARAAVASARRQILEYHARLSRFLADSELSALNGDPRPVVPASALLRSAVRAGLWAARRSDGLVDPCLLDALVAAGYARSHRQTGVVAPPRGPRRSAMADPKGRWRAVRVDDHARAIERPAGLRLDLGGSGKGHVADLIADRLARFARWVVDCGGDIRVGGGHRVEIAHPLRDEPAAQAIVDNGAVATSSVISRAWMTCDGRRAHHLLDPCTGRPVWTGLLTATALAPTTLEAETLAKTALLRGADDARAVLAPHGGLLVHEDGRVEAIGPHVEVAR
jgi:thiamine biosynthesis lipoprotein